MKSIFLLICGLTSSIPCAADDDRIRTVKYDAGDVVLIRTAIGTPTLIQFAPDETVLDGQIGMVGLGDAKAWSVGPRGSNLMIKPIAKNPDTHMLVVTTKRTYAFELRLLDRTQPKKPNLIIRFSYPQEKRDRPSIAVAEGGSAARMTATGKVNRRYYKQGDAHIAPSHVEDDGRFTFMSFPKVAELPVVYKVLPDGSEALTNTHVEPTTGKVVVHETAAKFMLRYGSAVLAIRNDGYVPDGSINPTGTTESGTVRVERKKNGE